MRKELLVFFVYGLFYYISAFQPSSPHTHPSFNSKQSKQSNPITPISKINNPQKSTQKAPQTGMVYNPPTNPPSILSSEEKVPPLTEEDFNFQLQWYVIAESTQILPNTPYEAKVWGKTYVYWKDQQNHYYAIQNVCKHRGASLSNGIIHPETNCIQCPYHGLEFDGKGILKKIPGQILGQKPLPSLWNQEQYPILEKEGWIYLNVIPENVYNTETISKKTLEKTLYIEPEASMQPSSRVFCNIPAVPTYARIVSENLLDILHITYVHSFGNKDSPIPLNEPEPYTLRGYNTEGILTSFSNLENQSIASVVPETSFGYTDNRKHRKNKEQRVISTKTRAILFREQVFSILNPISTMTKKWLSNSEKEVPIETNTAIPQPINQTIPSKNQHYGIRYLFETNPNSVIRKLFNYNHIIIETEFLLPHTTVSRVRFGSFYKTVVAFSLPVSENETHLFIKLYRNYWIKDSVPSLFFPFSVFSYLVGTVMESVSDSLMLWMLKETFKEDAGILKRLTNDAEQQGKYNLKYDKFPYLYRNLYKKYVHSKESHNPPHFSPSFPILPSKSRVLLLDKIEHTNHSTPLPPLHLPLSCKEECTNKN
jgi:phenylpropionate dioxygenase-like ring-hydroxylating dioxygenase large terminal subunit